jgi:hypothetical protein
MDMIADRVIEARDDGWQEADKDGNRLRRTTGIANLGGGTESPWVSSCPAVGRVPAKSAHPVPAAEQLQPPMWPQPLWI